MQPCSILQQILVTCMLSHVSLSHKTPKIVIHCCFCLTWLRQSSKAQQNWKPTKLQLLIIIILMLMFMVLSSLQEFTWFISMNTDLSYKRPPTLRPSQTPTPVLFSSNNGCLVSSEHSGSSVTMRLRSSTRPLHQAPRTRTAYGGRAFSSAVLTIWNNLPTSVIKASSLLFFVADSRHLCLL